MAWNLFNLDNAEPFRYCWGDVHVNLALLSVIRRLESPTPCVGRLICAQYAVSRAQIDAVACELKSPLVNLKKVCVASAYQEAIAVAMRRNAPLAGYSIDRGSVFNATQGLSSDTVESLVCYWFSNEKPSATIRAELQATFDVLLFFYILHKVSQQTIELQIVVYQSCRCPSYELFSNPCFCLTRNCQ